MNKKYIIWGCTFVVSLILGYSGAKIISSKDSKSIPDTENIGGLVYPTSSIQLEESVSDEIGVINTDDNSGSINAVQPTTIDDNRSKGLSQTSSIAEQPEQIEKMLPDEFERLLLDFNDNSLLGKHPKIKRPLTIKVVGMNPEESMIPQDVLGVRTKIENETWTTAKVNGVSYDAIGRISSVTILAVYE